MSQTENQQDQLDHLENVHQTLTKTELFIEKYKNLLLAAVAVVVLVVAGIFSFKNFYLEPKERNAAAAMFGAERAFAKDSFQLAINGNAEFDGFETIISNYGMTKSANLATAYTGIAYYHLGNFDKATKYLKDFNANDPIVAPSVVGLVGDCFVEMGNIGEGIKFFEKAAAKGSNNLVAPLFLKKAGIAYLELKNNGAAEKAFAQIKNSYPNSVEATDIDKFIEIAQLSK